MVTKLRDSRIESTTLPSSIIDKSETISPELFDDYILGKALPMYLRMHIEEEALIDAQPRGRLNE
jgi:hypothetical protein